MDEFKDSVKKGFSACKADIEELKKENIILRELVNKLERENTEKEDKLNEILVEIKGMKIAMDYIKDFSKASPVETPVSEVKAPLRETPKVQDPYEALLAFKAKSNKRDLLKQKLLSLISENGMNLAELKFMFVDHFKYCSKATFYNYLKELELEKSIKIERENSKNFVYLTTHLRREI